MGQNSNDIFSGLWNQSIRIEQYCVFCGKPTNEIQKHTFDQSRHGEDKINYQYLTVPFPAHKKCFTKAKWLDGFIIFGIVILSLWVTARITSVFGNTTGLCLGAIIIIIPFVLSVFAIKEYSKRWKKRWKNIIWQYYESHRI